MDQEELLVEEVGLRRLFWIQRTNISVPPPTSWMPQVLLREYFRRRKSLA